MAEDLAGISCAAIADVKALIPQTTLTKLPPQTLGKTIKVCEKRLISTATAGTLFATLCHTGADFKARFRRVFCGAARAGLSGVRPGSSTAGEALNQAPLAMQAGL